jgi:N-ethylmaleimide reductase
MINENILLESYPLNATTNLKNRIVMAPLTRCRADSKHVPTDVMIEYYQQRSSAGLIITEGTSPSINGDGYARVPGIYNAEQIEAWKKITAAVHKKGGKIFLQMMHVGRIGHPLNQLPGAQIVAPSAIQAAVDVHVDFSEQANVIDRAVPRALRTEEIKTVIDEYKQATANAFEAGFDGVELHAANGYLPHQFLSTNTNARSDQYGGSAENRIRFVIETLAAMASVNGADKIGIRISPVTAFNDMHDANPIETYTTLLKALNVLQLCYVHVIRSADPKIDAFKLVRDHYQGTCIANGDFDFTTGCEAIQLGLADLISYGSAYISNPDLVERFRNHQPLTMPYANTFYTPGAKGYIDYLPFTKE